MQTSEQEERKWYLAARSLTDTLTPEEEAEWQEMISDEAFRSQFERIRRYWNDSEKLPYLKINAEADWDKVRNRIRTLQQSERKVFPQLLKYAATVAAIVLVSVFVWKLTTSSDEAISLTTIDAPKGARTSITLPDSSRVWLNAESRITFDQKFGIGNRDLTLEGEAYFDVKKGEVPFQVHTASYDVRVLGTAFNVKVYPDDDMTSTTLIHGSLKVSRTDAKGNQEEVLLHPNERIVLKGTASDRLSNPIVHEKNIDALAEADWKNGWLSVRGESLAQLAKKIERLYNVTIEFKDENMKSYRYSGRIQEFSLEQVLHALALTSPVRFEIREKVVRLSIDESAKSKYQVQP